MMALCVMIEYMFKLFLSKDSVGMSWIIYLSLLPFVTFLCGVVIPGSYLLKTENVRSAIVSKGWCNPCRISFQARNPRIAPHEEIEMGVNPQQANNRIPADIPTISRAISVVHETF